jgi:hypothetical protein
MSFNFAVNDSSTEAETNDDSDEERTFDFESNQTGDFYLSIGDWKATVGAILEEMGEDKLKITGDDGLEDLGRLLGKYDSKSPMQQLHMVASLAKSTFGKRQANKNSHSAGLQNGKAPESHPEKWDSYALFSKDLPTIEWGDLDGGERESLEAMGINPSTLGFDTTFGGPKIPVLGGRRLPIVLEEGDDLMEDCVDLLKQGPEEPSYFNDEEGGLVEGSEEVEESDDSDSEEVIDLAANPERVGEVSVTALRSGDRSVTHITNLRTIQTMLRVEKEGKNRSSAVQRLEERRNALQGGNDEEDEADEADADTEEEDDDNEEVDSVEETDEKLSDAEKSLVAALLNSGDADNFEEAKQMVLGS